jgi:hypothetical protein
MVREESPPLQAQEITLQAKPNFITAKSKYYVT